jgi:hypothetical protein
MKPTLALATLLIAGFAQAQDLENKPWMPLENRIGLALGIGSVTYLDKNSSPLVYRSRPKNLRLFYNLEGNTFLLSIDLDAKMGGNGPKYHNDRTLFFQEEDYKGNTEDKKFPAGGSLLAGRISVGAYYKIPSTQQSTVKVAAGGRIMSEMFYPQGWNSGGMYNALSFSPEVWTHLRVNEQHQFTAAVRIPVVTRLSRLPYDNTVSAPDKNQVQGFFSNSTWASPATFLAPAMTLGYNYEVNARWGAGLNYDLGWYGIQTPQPMKALSHAILANIHHQF